MRLPVEFAHNRDAVSRVAVNGRTSRSAMMFGTVRPGPREGKRPERATMMLGCVHQPGWLFPPPVSSVQWGRAGVSPYRTLPAGVSPGYSGDPCFCVVGSYLEAGVEVFQGAAQCALAAFNTRQQRLASPVVSQASPGVTARTYIFELIFALLALLTVGCGQSASGLASDGGAATDASTAVMDALSTDRDVLRQDIYAVLPGDANLFPYDLPGTVPFRNYPPPAQFRRNCPAATDGDPSILPPRLVSPLSPMRLTTQRPTLTWELAPGTTAASIQVCRDPCCVIIVGSYSHVGGSFRISRPLRPGVYFWRARGLLNSRVGREYSFVWEFGIPHHDSELDTFKGPVHDINGDGYDDVVAEIQNAVRVYWGGESGLVDRRFNDFRVDYAGQVLSNRVTFVSDFNSDGFADVAVAGSGNVSGVSFQTVRLLYGAPGRLIDSGVAHVVGYVSEVVDLNGDGFVDLVGAVPANFGLNQRVRALVLYGSGDWSQYSRQLIDDPDIWESNAGFGFAGTGGDVDGDGYGDVYIGNPRHNRYRGRLYLFRGGRTGLESAPARQFDPPPEIAGRSEWGGPIGVGDINGDRLGDVVVMSQDIKQVLIFGASVLAEVALQTVQSTYPTSLVGSATGPAVDFNGDGTMDFYLGCSVCLDREHPLVTAGRVVVLTEIDGRSSRLLREFEPPPNDGLRGGSYFGQPIIAIDVDGDGFDDLITQDPETVSTPRVPARGYITVDFGGADFGSRRLQLFGVDLPGGDPLGDLATILGRARLAEGA